MIRSPSEQRVCAENQRPSVPHLRYYQLSRGYIVDFFPCSVNFIWTLSEEIPAFPQEPHFAAGIRRFSIPPRSPTSLQFPQPSRFKNLKSQTSHCYMSSVDTATALTRTHRLQTADTSSPRSLMTLCINLLAYLAPRCGEQLQPIATLIGHADRSHQTTPRQYHLPPLAYRTRARNGMTQNHSGLGNRSRFWLRTMSLRSM